VKLASAVLVRLQPGRISGAEIFLLSVFLVLGSVASLAIPVGAGFDEEMHVLRVSEMPAFRFESNESLEPRVPFPAKHFPEKGRGQPRETSA